MMPHNDNTAIRGLHVVLPGKTLAWFGAIGLIHSFWSIHHLNLPAFFSAGSLVAVLLCGLALIALLRLPVVSPLLALAAFTLTLVQGLMYDHWAFLPLVASLGIGMANLVQRSSMRMRRIGQLAAVACIFVAVACLAGLPGLRGTAHLAPGVQTHIDAILTLICGYSIFMASLRPLAPPVNDKCLVAITVLGSLLAAVAWFVLAEQDRQLHISYLDPSGARISAAALLIPLNQWLPDLIFFVCFAFTWMLTRSARLSVVLTQRSRDLEHASTHDHLTGLPNKRKLIQAIDDLCSRFQQTGESVGLVLLDLNGLKLINDSIGLETGDQVLKEVARRIRDVVDPRFLVARLEGDEFVVLLQGESKMGAVQCARTILGVIGKPYTNNGIELHLTASAGLTSTEGGATDPVTLLRQADLAITYAKQSGRNTWREYAPELGRDVDTRLALRAELQKALDHNHFVMHYQPIINGHTGRIMGAEALIRWPHPERGFISPAVFVPLAEDTGLIHALSHWVLEAACRDLHWLQSQAVVDFPFVINVSPLHFQRPDFTQEVQDMLARYGLAPKNIEIELTEGLFLDNVQETIDKLRHLQSLGIKISIDDFGTGYSSLRYLKSLPIDKIKIDRSFVQEIVSDRNDAAISKAIIGLAHHLNLRVVAEGVETAAQYWYLKRNFCDEFQGYLFSRPEPVDKWAQRLQLTGGVVPLPTQEDNIDNERTLLLLDDEENILKALHRLLRRDGYKIFHARTSQEAFDILAVHPIRVILSDQRLKETTGTEFFAMVKNLYPDTVRIILSGYSDLKSVTEAINHGAIYKFLTKPWDEAELRQELAQAFKVAVRR